jgi:hypothetical protein
LRHSLYPNGTAVYATDVNIVKYAAPLFKPKAEMLPVSEQLIKRMRAAAEAELKARQMEDKDVISSASSQSPINA